MSKLSFRARALDTSKPMPVYRIDELPDLPDFAAINRGVPQMPTGMEKEEETEHHLQRALSAQQVYGTSEKLVIPVPDINTVTEKYLKQYKPTPDYTYKPPRQYIHVQPFGMDQEIPDYDLDSDDETWLLKQTKKLEVTALKFETMMDRLEKGSGQTVMTLHEAKGLLKEDDDLIIAVYDYWLNKRLKLQHTLIPSVRTEKRDGSSSSNPYVAFRRRTEKMQTRKNRKNDEVSYEKMLKLKRDINKALTILEQMKRREKSKKELLKLTIEIMEKRYAMQDFDGCAYKEANAKRHTLPNTFIQSYTEYINARKFQDRGDEVTHHQTYTKKTKRKYNKRKEREKVVLPPQPPVPQYTEIDVLGPSGAQQEMYSSDEDQVSPVSDHDTETDDPDGVYAFRRKPGCYYHAPISPGSGSWPWHGPSASGVSSEYSAPYKYSLTALSLPSRQCVGYGRRRVGRGGRVLLDRGFSEWNQSLWELDLSSPPSSPPHSPSSLTDLNTQYLTYISKHNIAYFRPCSPDMSGSSAPPLTPALSPGLPSLDFSLESYENHREQLLQMQRTQQEQLLKQEVAEVIGECVPGQERTHRATTLDSERAAFAVSAVSLVDSHTTNTSHDTAISQHHIFHNGPGSSGAVVSVGPAFSTSPAANVLQLNYPHPQRDTVVVTLPAKYTQHNTAVNKESSCDTTVIKDNSSVVVMEVT